VALSAFRGSIVGQFFNDMYLSSTAILVSIGMSVVYAFIFIGLISAFAEQIAWICIITIQIALLGGSGALYYIRDQKIQNFSIDSSLTTEQVVEMTESFNQEVLLLLIGCAITGAIGLIFLCCICCYYKSLKGAIDCIDASADFLMATKRIIFVPIVFFILMVIVVLLWIGNMALVISLNKIEPDDLIP